MEKTKLFRKLLMSTNRAGMNDLFNQIVQKGFFESPASARFHAVYEGGLADHSYEVYEMLAKMHKRLRLDEPTAPGQKPLPVKPENIIIAGLLHDLCKMGAYKLSKARKYSYNKDHPKGHGELSIKMIKAFIKLEPIEEMMIRFHMGVYHSNKFDEKKGEYPLRGDHSNDDNLTPEESKKARYGKSLGNAWYHNPIVKVISICDELVTLQAKAEENNP